MLDHSAGNISLELCVKRFEQSAAWQIRSDRDTVILHLGGRLETLETETLSGQRSKDLPLPGEIWKIAAGETYRGRAKGGSMIYLQAELPPAAGQTTPVQSRLGYNDPHLRDWLLELKSRLQDQEPVDAIEPILEKVTHRLSLPTPKSENQGLPCTLQEHLKEMIEQRLVGPIKLGELCEESGLSRTELCRRFGHAFGDSPGQYILRQRLRRAAFLLSQRRGDLTEVALECGFSSHSHLTSTFRRLTGVTPSNLLKTYEQ